MKNQVAKQYKLYASLEIDINIKTEIETASERGNTSRGNGRGRSRLIVEDPDVGLDPITP